MNKPSHIRLSGYLIQNTLLARYSFFVKLGSILPDLLFFTYITGHRYEETIEWFSASTARLLTHGRLHALSALHLGYLLHYAADYFTLPHNSTYTEGLWKHLLYEKELENYLEFFLSIPENQRTINISFLNSTEQIRHSYTEQSPSFESDISHTLSLGQKICFSFIYSILFQTESTQDYIPELQFVIRRNA